MTRSEPYPGIYVVSTTLIFPDKDAVVVATEVATVGLRPPINVKIPKALEELLNSCWLSDMGT